MDHTCCNLLWLSLIIIGRGDYTDNWTGEEITLTIGQAFDLAYRRFLETSGKDLEVQHRLMLLQQKVKRLESENSILRQRLTDVAQIKGQVSNHCVLLYTV